MAMALFPYLNFGGNCKEAFEYYAANLGGQIEFMMTQSQQPDPSQVPAGQESDIMYASMKLGGGTLAANDVPKDVFQPMRSAYVTLTLNSIEAAEHANAVLGEGGQMFMPMTETFFAYRFGMLKDKFGVSWMLIYEKPMG
jgi:PhnB protein